MKEFREVLFDAVQCKRELDAFGGLLNRNRTLREREDIQPFFRSAPQLSTLLGTLSASIAVPNLLAYEFDLAGDFRADVVVGNRDRDQIRQSFCMIEFEEGGPNSIFTAVNRRQAKEWGRRFEHGFSQLVDWFCATDDWKNTSKFVQYFGSGHVNFHGVLVVGRSTDLSPDDQRRLRWRSGHIVIASHPIHCLTYDDIYHDLSARLSHFKTPPQPLN